MWRSSELRVPTTLLIQIRCKWGILSSVIPYSSRNIFLRQQSSHQLSTMPKTHPYANEIFLQKISHLLLIYFERLTPRKTSIFSVDQPQTPRKTHTPHIFPFNPQSATIPRGAWLKSNPNHNNHFPRRAWLKAQLTNLAAIPSFEEWERVRDFRDRRWRWFWLVIAHFNLGLFIYLFLIWRGNTSGKKNEILLFYLTHHLFTSNR